LFYLYLHKDIKWRSRSVDQRFWCFGTDFVYWKQSTCLYKYPLLWNGFDAIIFDLDFFRKGGYLNKRQDKWLFVFDEEGLC